jgi:hypothetical protein
MLSLCVTFVLLGLLWAVPSHAQAAPLPVSLLWDCVNCTGYQSFQVLRCQDLSPASTGCDPTSSTILATIPFTQRTYTDATPVVGSRYCWKARAVLVDGTFSAPTNTVCRSMLIPALGAPTNLRWEVPLAPVHAQHKHIHKRPRVGMGQ